MREGHLARLELRPAGERRGRNAVVRRAEGPLRDHGVIPPRQPGDGMYLGGLQQLLAAHVRQDAGDTLGKHALARARRADKQDIVPSRGRDLERALGVILPLDLGEVRLRPARELQLRRSGAVDFTAPVQILKHLRYIPDAVDLEGVHKRRLGGVVRRDEQALHPGAPGGEGHGQRAAHRPQLARERELADKGAVTRQGADSPRGGEYA